LACPSKVYHPFPQKIVARTMAARLLFVLFIAGPTPWWQVVRGAQTPARNESPPSAAPPSPADASVTRGSSAASPSPSIANVNASIIVRGPGATAASMLERGAVGHQVAIRNPVPSANSQSAYTVHAGFISRGDDLLVEKMTAKDAQLKCVSLKGCKGFTFQGNPAEGPVLIYFKSKWDLRGTGWSSYRVDRALPAGWEPADEPISGNTFYFNRALGVRTWDLPQSPSSETAMPKQDKKDKFMARLADNEQPQDQRQNTLRLERMSVIRIQAIVKTTNWFQPYRRGRDSEFVGSGFAVYPDEQSDSSDNKAKEDPVFITNAHVVDDAHTVSVQLPTIGQLKFDAHVPIIYSDFDLAIVKLKEPSKFLDALKAAGRTLTILRIKELPIDMAMKVAAYGFPLGSMSLKVSEGVIAGTENVKGAICYQSTAPISPGSSGGPLFVLGPEDDDQEPSVIGVNFASASQASAQNQNYVVPSVHIRQLLHAYRKTNQQPVVNLMQRNAEVDEKVAALELTITQELPHSASFSSSSSAHISRPAVAQRIQRQEKGRMLIGSRRESSVIKVTMEQLAKSLPLLQSLVADGKVRMLQEDSASPGGSVLEIHGSSGQEAKKNWEHFALKIAPIDALGVEANDALYNSSGGCNSGFYISKIYPNTSLSLSDPPVPAHSFITAVDGVTLDSFGMGITSGFLQDPLRFESIMGLHSSIDENVKISVCQRGKASEHIVSMAWRDHYNRGVKTITEAFYHPEALDYEAFADFTVMELSLNHINLLLRNGPPTLGRWMIPENQVRSRITVTHVRTGTYASRVLKEGMVLETVNGQNVSSLDDFRKVFIPGSDVFTMKSDRGVTFTVDFLQSLREQLTLANARPDDYEYLLTPHIEAVSVQLGLLKGCGQEDGQQEQDVTQKGEKEREVIQEGEVDAERAEKSRSSRTPQSLYDMLKQVEAGEVQPLAGSSGGSRRVQVVVVNRGKLMGDTVIAEDTGDGNADEIQKNSFALSTGVRAEVDSRKAVVGRPQNLPMKGQTNNTLSSLSSAAGGFMKPVSDLATRL